MLKLLLRILLLFFYSTSCVANISKRSRQSCSYSHTIKNGIQKIIFARKEWQTMDKEKGIELFFNPCEYLDESLCGKNKSVCIQNARDHSILVHGEHFQLDEERNLNISLSRSDCKLTIIPECQENMQEQPQLIRRNKCEFEVKMMSSDCDPIKCSLKHRGEEIDMQPLNQKHIVKSNNKTFSIVLCNTNPDCGIQGVTSCDITDSNNIIPLSSRNREFRYDENTNEIIQHGTFKGRENQRKFELKIKCDWDIKTSEIRYKEVPIQGKYYKFEMKSRHACFRVTPQCEIFYKYYFYDFTTLHRDTYWKVDNLPNDLEMLLSICGKQRKPPFGSGNNCSSSFSQACHKSAEGYKNMGSIQTKFNIQNEIITTTIIRGDTCKNNKKNEQNSTHIEFRCSKTEENPTFLRYDNCSVSLIWNTPAACPKNNKDSCESIRPVASNTTVVTAYNIYNLSSLQAKNGNHILKDEENTSLQYELNIGAPVVDDDAPCKKDMMIALKDLSEYNVRHKVKSFGQMKQAYENDKHQLVIETVGGDLCPQQQIYYKGKIVLECCDNETCKEDLSILNKTDCTVTFLWKTRAVCSEEKTSTCVFKYPFDDRFLFDFNQMKQSYLEIKDGNTTYLVDMCQNNESKCSESDCTYVAVDKSLMTHGNKTHLEFSMNKTCSKDNKFNKTVFELVCDEILNNDHFVLKGLKNCILTFQLKTHVACFDKELVIDVSKIEAKNQSITLFNKIARIKKLLRSNEWE
ncbi:hypothetical protein JTB14_018198 [Gonioctena quinquepunctata]|nr:hypothetical protein JTB14_018198 [Gonioctena quinquepunctata]